MARLGDVEGEKPDLLTLDFAGPGTARVTVVGAGVDVEDDSEVARFCRGMAILASARSRPMVIVSPMVVVDSSSRDRPLGPSLALVATTANDKGDRSSSARRVSGIRSLTVIGTL